MRYILSDAGNKKTTIENIRKRFAWIREHKEAIDSLTLRADGGNFDFKNKSLHNAKVAKIFFEHMVIGLLGETPPDENGVTHPVLFGRMRYNRPKTLLSKVSKEDIIDHYTFQNEFMFRLVDKKTRETGRWVKLISGVDARGFSVLNKEFDFGLMRAIAGSSKNSVFLHPQLLETHAAVNFPSSLLNVLKVARKLMSSQMADKQSICLGGRTDNRSDAAEKCPFVKRLNLGPILPAFLGGVAECPAHLGDPSVQPVSKKAQANERPPNGKED